MLRQDSNVKWTEASCVVQVHPGGEAYIMRTWLDFLRQMEGSRRPRIDGGVRSNAGRVLAENEDGSAEGTDLCMHRGARSALRASSLPVMPISERRRIVRFLRGCMQLSSLPSKSERMRSPPRVATLMFDKTGSFHTMC